MPSGSWSVSTCNNGTLDLHQCFWGSQWAFTAQVGSLATGKWFTLSRNRNDVWTPTLTPVQADFRRNNSLELTKQAAPVLSPPVASLLGPSSAHGSVTAGAGCCAFAKPVIDGRTPPHDVIGGMLSLSLAIGHPSPAKSDTQIYLSINIRSSFSGFWIQWGAIHT